MACPVRNVCMDCVLLSGKGCVSLSRGLYSDTARVADRVRAWQDRLRSPSGPLRLVGSLWAVLPLMYTVRYMGESDPCAPTHIHTHHVYVHV